MRILYCLLLMLTACASHPMRCDAHLKPINAARSLNASVTQGAP